jgi:RES domain
MPNRFNEGVGAFSTLYLSEDQMVALFEVEALFGSPYDTWVPVPNRNWTILSVSVVLQSIVDLTQAPVQAHLATTAQELTGDWRGYRLRSAVTSVNQPSGVPAPTQELGAALYTTAGVEGFLAISAKVPTRRNLVVFPEKLLPGSNLECRDEKGGLLYRIPPPRRKRST